MIRVSRLYKSFGGQKILIDVSLEVSDGEILVVLGESGAGKSVLLKHLIGLLRPDTGVVTIDGLDITSLSESKLLLVRQKMGYLFQEGALYDFLNVFENIAFPLREHTRLTEKKIAAKVKDILNLVDLDGVEEKMPSELSGGMKKRVGLARAVVSSPKILLCDEPTSGLDPIRSRDISDLIHQVSKKIECTMVVTSHDIENSFRIADRLVLLQEGRVIAKGTPKELKASSNSFVKEFVH
jgi:phospholipid/cholesterol/gamma-HCH transport system ATP-binding protein